MKLLFRIALVFTALPPLLGILGIVLSNMLGCSGMDHIETCATSGSLRFVAPLIAMVWVSAFTLPTGALVLAFLTIADRVRRFRSKRTRDI